MDENLKASCENYSTDNPALIAAKKYFNIDYLYPWQQLVVSNILDAAKILYGEKCVKIDSEENSQSYQIDFDEPDEFENFPEDFENESQDFQIEEENSEEGFSAETLQFETESEKTEISETESETQNENSVEILANVENKGKQIVLLPTGAGKSLCFLIPSLLLPGPTLVMYPLLALMSDQKRRMDEGGISNVVFCGNQTPEEREENFKKIEAGAKIILANPEVLQSEKLVQRLAKCGIVHAAIDEAHCVSEWGDSFRPAYLTLGTILKKLNIPLITAFTATASPVVLNRVAEILFDGQAHLVRSDSDRANIHYNVIYSYAKDLELFRLVQSEQRPIIVFCGTRKSAENTARNLRQFFSAVPSKNKDFPNDPEIVRFYHAGLSREEKTETEKWFFPKDNAILCCTCAFGMGVDKKNVRTVIHRDVPSTAESFIQESGRGARDGGIANSFLLWNYNDYKNFSSFEHNSRERVLLKFAQSKTCRRQVLLDALHAEQAACSGCDICQALGKIPNENENSENSTENKTDKTKSSKKKLFNLKKIKKISEKIIPTDYTFSPDRNFVLKFMAHYSKSWNNDQAIGFLKEKLNSQAQNEFGMRLWQADDIKEILEQLFDEQKIFTCRWPFKNKISVAKSVAATKLKITPRQGL